MSVLGVLARVALFVYPRDFRLQFGDQILADIDVDPSHGASQLFDLLHGGIAMRLDTVLRNLSYAVRRLRSAPLFVAIIVLTFALGIGANVAVFSVLNAVILRPLPFSDPSRLVIMHSHDPQGNVFPAASITDASDIRSQTHTLAGIVAASDDELTLLVDGHPFSLAGIDAMPEYFAMLGIKPQLGRVLTTADSRPGVHNVVISDELWRKRLGSDPNVLGRSISLDGHGFIVVGVLRPGQVLAEPSSESIGTFDFVEALPELGTARERGVRRHGVIGRMRSGRLPWNPSMVPCWAPQRQHCGLSLRQSSGFC